MLLEIANLPEVEMAFMNEVHVQDVHIINTLFEMLLCYENEPTEKNAVAMDEIFDQWLAHTVSHFEGEEIKMRQTGFPPYAMHKGEHDRILGTMKQLLNDWKQTCDPKPLKIYMIEILPQWLSNHILTMDMVTARFFKTGISPCGI